MDQERQLFSGEMSPHLNPAPCVSLMVFVLGQLSPTVPVLVPAHGLFHMMHFWVYSPTLECKPKATGDSKERFLTVCP